MPSGRRPPEPSRRRLLGALATAGTLGTAGCVGGATDGATPTDQAGSETTTDDTTTDDSGSDPGTTPVSEPTLAVETGAPADIDPGSTVAVLPAGFQTTVADAADSDRGVDLDRYDFLTDEDAVALGRFDRVQYDGTTYEPRGDFAPFGTEAVHRFELRPVENPDDTEVTDYEALTDAERRAFDRIRDAGGALTVGRHESPSDALFDLRGHDAIRNDGTVYELTVTVGDPAGHHVLWLDAVEGDGDAPDIVTPAVDPAVWAAIRRTDGAESGRTTVPDAREGLASLLETASYVVTPKRVLALELLLPED